MCAMEEKGVTLEAGERRYDVVSELPNPDGAERFRKNDISNNFCQIYTGISRGL